MFLSSTLSCFCFYFFNILLLICALQIDVENYCLWQMGNCWIIIFFLLLLFKLFFLIRFCWSVLCLLNMFWFFFVAIWFYRMLHEGGTEGSNMIFWWNFSFNNVPSLIFFINQCYTFYFASFYYKLQLLWILNDVFILH